MTRIQLAGSPIMEEIIFFHDQILFVLAIILITIKGLLYQALTIKMPHQGFTKGGVGNYKDLKKECYLGFH